MAYESEMREIARRARSRWGALREAIFIEPQRNSLLVFEGITIRADQLPETDMLRFGYSGTGSHCYATLLAALGFRNTNVDNVSTPAKLSADGKWTRGKRKSAQWSVEAEGQTVDEARKNIDPTAQGTNCVIREEILSDGSQKDLTETTTAGSDAEALSMVQRRMPAGSTLISSTVRETLAETEVELVADTPLDAARLGQERIKPSEASYKSCVAMRCVEEPRKGFFGVGRRTGRFVAKYKTTSREVTLAYRTSARIRVLYGPMKLLCSQCGKVMATTSQGVHHVSGSPSPEAAILQLRCDTCDITRFEKRWEIEGRWIEWEDNSAPSIV